MIRWSASILAVALAATAASAHFVFVVPDAGGAKATVVFSDNLDPDDAVDVGKIGAMKLFLHAPNSKPSPVALEKGEHCFKVTLPGSGPRVVAGSVDYGVMTKGRDGNPSCSSTTPRPSSAPFRPRDSRRANPRPPRSSRSARRANCGSRCWRRASRSRTPR